MDIHPLRKYRQSQRLTLVQFGDIVGVSKAVLSRLETGTRAPSADILLRIHEATHGAVTPNDLLGVETKRRVKGR